VKSKNILGSLGIDLIKTLIISNVAGKFAIMLNFNVNVKKIPGNSPEILFITL